MLLSLLLQLSPAAPQQSLQQLSAVQVKYPLYNYTLNNQTLYTACPCLGTWTYTKADGSFMQLSGCANPDNDPAVSWAA